ncbi:MAG: pyridoxamine kinase [Lachnospiraceae bacterium]|nr:pyridoxamine kinase [Lachnospiraceae bacterium]
MSHNNQKKIALINDFTGFGKCSIAVSLPIISALKIQCCPVPTSVFSNHTAYPEYFFDDYTDKMQDYIDNWKKLGLLFEGISTGFLGSGRQIEIVQKFIKDFKTERTVVIVDPVMGDYGVKYATYTQKLCDRMKELVSLADIVTPNLTEGCILTGIPYDEDMDYEKIKKMAVRISETGPKKVVITGIVRGSYITNYVYEKGVTDAVVRSKKIGCERSGTGDIFSAIISADAVNGIGLLESVKKSVSFIKKCLIISEERNIPKEDGICFEDVLTKLR